MNEKNGSTSQRPPRHREDHDDAPRGARPSGLALDPPIPTPLHEPEIPPDRLDQDALRIVYRLRHMGHKAYFVGGCVRDLLLGAKPKDYDLATDAHPGEVRAIFRNCRLIGRRFRLAHVYFRDGKVIEVATFRKNPTDLVEDTGEESDLLITRDNVFGTAEEDAVRRDLTVNGLFYDPAIGEVIDFVGGRADLAAHRMATIGDPEVRMREDPVRALRAVRFAARLGFAIAPDTFEAMRRHAGELARCAPARVLEEIFKVLRCGGSARAFALLKACGALPVILPALGAAHDRWDEAQRKNFIAHLGALDRLIKAGEEVSEAVLLGALLVHLGAPPPTPEGEDEAPDEVTEGEEPATPRVRASPAAEALLEELVRTSRLPRKVAERIRLALHAQAIFFEPTPAKGRRRRRGRGLAGQPYFTDALQLLRITVEATGAGVDVYHRWHAEALKHPPVVHEPVERERGRDHGRERGRRGEHGRRGEASRPARDGRGHGPATSAGPGTGSGGSSHGRTSSIDMGGPGRDTGEALPAGGQGAITTIDAGAADPGPASAGEPSGEGAGRAKRRRRGGRRRRRRGEGEGGGPGGTGSAPSGSPPPSSPLG
jgi:poly(A) polymerase